MARVRGAGTDVSNPGSVGRSLISARDCLREVRKGHARGTELLGTTAIRGNSAYVQAVPKPSAAPTSADACESIAQSAVRGARCMRDRRHRRQRSTAWRPRHDRHTHLLHPGPLIACPCRPYSMRRARLPQIFRFALAVMRVLCSLRTLPWSIDPPRGGRSSYITFLHAEALLWEASLGLWAGRRANGRGVRA